MHLAVRTLIDDGDGLIGVIINLSAVSMGYIYLHVLPPNQHSTPYG